MVSIDTQSLDAVIGTFGWVVGLALILVATSVFGLTVFWARALDEPGLGRIIGRTVLAFLAVGMMTGGGMLLGIGTEAFLGYPFGQTSGGTVLFAYLLGLTLATMELALTHGLARRLADRTESTLPGLFAWGAFGLGQVTWGLTLAMAFICFVVAINMALA